MSDNRMNGSPGVTRRALSGKINEVLCGIRIPDLPYPAATPAVESTPDWRPLLLSCWNEQRDERVTHLIRSVNLEWSAQQINAAYLADRIMDVFLKSSGLHPIIARRIARLRFFLAWRMNLDGASAYSPILMEWLDQLQEWRGWSDSGGRSAKHFLDRLDALVIAVSGCFEAEDTSSLESFCADWQADTVRRQAQTGRLKQRLLDTERGAARQRRADATARALVGRALQGRHIPPAIADFIFRHWLGLLKQAVLEFGLESASFKHGSKLLEWLVWVGDPSLSDRDRDRLFHVGEQIGDRILDVWRRVFSAELPTTQLSGIEAVMVSRLKGEVPALEPALPPQGEFHWDAGWLEVEKPDTRTISMAEDQWYVEGEGQQEHRRYFFAYLEDTGEILWTNGAGVKLGLQAWSDFTVARREGGLRQLPHPTPFGDVLTDTVGVLCEVAEKQRLQREQAAREARARAEALRKEKAAAEQARQEEQAAREAELERLRQEAEAQRVADEAAEQERLWIEQKELAQRQVDSIKLGGWIALSDEPPGGDTVRMKLAVRINASRKLVFVDRLGLNRREYLEEALVQEVLGGKARVLGSSAEFDDTLSRVVGRIRVGRNG